MSIQVNKKILISLKCTKIADYSVQPHYLPVTVWHGWELVEPSVHLACINLIQWHVKKKTELNIVNVYCSI